MTPAEAVALAKQKAKLKATLSAELTGHTVAALLAAEERIERVRALHWKKALPPTSWAKGMGIIEPVQYVCGSCLDGWPGGRDVEAEPWPCPTIAALDAG